MTITMTEVFSYLREGTLGEDAGSKRSVEAKSTEAGDGNEHQQTGFATGTVANDHEFSANLSHGDG
jgi:hypothetical protein